MGVAAETFIWEIMLVFQKQFEAVRSKAALIYFRVLPSYTAFASVRLVNKCSIADATFDARGGLGPAKRRGILIPVGQPARDVPSSRGTLSKLPRRIARSVIAPNACPLSRLVVN